MGTSGLREAALKVQLEWNLEILQHRTEEKFRQGFLDKRNLRSTDKWK